MWEGSDDDHEIPVDRIDEDQVRGDAVHDDVYQGAPRLAEADIPQVLSILRQTDSVELKVTVAVDAHRATIRGMPIDPVEAQPRQVFFFDTPDLALDRAGVVLRARRIQGGRGDTVIKLRPIVPEQLSPELRQLRSFNVELDVLPGGFVCSASFKGRTTGKRVRDAAHGTLPLRMLFSKRQRAIYGEHAPEGIGLDDLRVARAAHSSSRRRSHPASRRATG